MNRKTVVLLAVVALLTPSLAACGGFSSEDDDGGDTIVVGTTDRFLTSGDVPAPVDPAYAHDAGAWNLLGQTVQTLMVQPRGGGEPVPEAAESCGFTDSRNERYVCKLCNGLKFSDGDPITAADVKFSIDRARALKADSGVLALLSTIDTVETQEDDLVIFHLRTADAIFPFKLSTPAAGIVNPKDYDSNTLRHGFSIDGSGPYTMQAEVKANEMVKATFTANPHYKGRLKPKNDKVVLQPFTDADAMGTAFEQGEIDVMARTMTPEQIHTLQNNTDSSVNLVEMPGLEIRYLGFNTNAPSVKNKAVRQAMARIIDRDQLVSSVYGTAAQPLYSLVPAGIVGHTNAFFNKYGAPNVSKAHMLLAEANVTTPVELTLHYTTDRYGPTTAREFEILKKQLNDSGLFDVSIQGTPWDTFHKAAQKGEYDVYGMSWFPHFPDADNYLAPFLDKDNSLKLPYANSEIRNTLIPQYRREADRLTISENLTDIQDIVADDVPVLPLWQSNQYLAARNDITGSVYVMNSSATLQLWELSHGMSDETVRHR
ncbi:ABC transporter substrate-binding protein [Streptomyces sp. NPDC049597]|uniref:ABC transporter substrate-binding protein n=1 Tax=Streptomyces sp. NPDC049597 TaxID=3155276 RepID=UPI003447B804